MQGAERDIAFGNRGYADPKPIDIEYLGKAEVFLLHLYVDGIQTLSAARDLSVDTEVR